MATGMSRILALCLPLAACSTTRPPGSGGGTEPVYTAAGAGAANRAGFDSLGSPAIARAALAYRETEAEQAPPMQLTASDGTGLALVGVDARAVVDGPIAFTELHLTFANPTDRRIEGRFTITLPPGAATSRLAMRQGDRWQEAEVVERQLAHRAYDDFLHRRQDPALLEKEAGNQLSARVFPIAPRERKEIIVSYSQELASSEATYRLPLRGLPAIDALHVKVYRGVGAPGAPLTYETATFDKNRWKPDRDYELPLASRVQGLSAGNLAVARIDPGLTAATAPVKSALILFDTSASRAPGFHRQVERLGQLIHEMSAASPALQIEVATFDNAPAPIYAGPAAAFGEAQLDAVRARRPLGASNLSAALAWAATRPRRERAIIISDAVVTAGDDDGAALIAAARALPVDRIDVVLVGGIRDDDTAGQLARGAAAHDGVVLDGGLEPRELARRINQTTVSGIDVSVAGADFVWPRRLDGVQPGDQFLVYAELPKAAASLTVHLGGAISRDVTVPLARAERPLVERAMATARIAGLTAERAATTDDARKKQLKARIVELLTRHRVLSDFTALLVLETAADYERFGIDRKALADILTVGPRGVTLAKRADAMIIATPPAKNDKGKDTTKTLDGKFKQKEPETGNKVGRVSADDDDDGELDEVEKKELEPAKPEDTTAAPVVDQPPPPPAAPEPMPPAERRPAPTRSHRAGAAQRTSASRITMADRAPVLDPEGTSQGVIVDGTVANGAAAPSAASPSIAANEEATGDDEEESGPPPLTGHFAAVSKMIDSGHIDGAVVDALAWRSEDPGDVMALVALGQALEARGDAALAARAYASIIDLFPSRADLRRFAAQRLERLSAEPTSLALAIDSLGKAEVQRPDHLTVHRQLAYDLVRAGRLADAFAALEHGLERSYPDGRFAGGVRILREDLGIVGAAWIAREPARRAEVLKRLAAHKATAVDRAVDPLRPVVGDRRQRRRLPHLRRQRQPRLLPEHEAGDRRRAVRRRHHRLRPRVLHHRRHAQGRPVPPAHPLLLARADGLRHGRAGDPAPRRQGRPEHREPAVRGHERRRLRRPRHRRELIANACRRRIAVLQSAAWA